MTVRAGARPWLLLLSFGLLIALAAGFVWFAVTSFRAGPNPPVADGIVVLTGGNERVRAGLNLLARGDAGSLLISGVGHDAAFPRIARLAGADPALSARVTLGRHAHSTHGNALETADWAALQHVHSLIVVTAGYHMPRALAEMRASMPGVTLIPFAVQPPEMHVLSDARVWRLLGREYLKFLAVELGLADLAGRLGIGGAGSAGVEGQG